MKAEKDLPGNKDPPSEMLESPRRRAEGDQPLDREDAVPQVVSPTPRRPVQADGAGGDAAGPSFPSHSEREGPSRTPVSDDDEGCHGQMLPAKQGPGLDTTRYVPEEPPGIMAQYLRLRQRAAAAKDDDEED